MSELTRRLENQILEKFDHDKRKALTYIRGKCSFYARKADSKANTPYHENWRKIYRAYRNLESRLNYWLLLDEEDNFKEEYDVSM